MKVLLIGGTGTISTSISNKLIADGHQLYLINRGNSNERIIGNFTKIECDINNEQQLSELLKNQSFDCVADFIAFVPQQLERDYRLFKGITKQFIFISSASAYQKPLSDFRINEGTPLSNPYWEYSRNKIACEDYLMNLYRTESFPVTIVRPSHTYNDFSIPAGVHGDNGSWQVIKRMLDGKPIIVHGDGTSLWTMTHADDFAKAFVGLIGNIHAIGEAVNITSDEVLTWNQIYTCIANALNVEYKPYYVTSKFLADCSDYDFTGSLTGDKSNSVMFDNSKLKRLVPEFTATIRFDTGVARAIKYALSHENVQVADAKFDDWCDRVITALDEACKKVQNK